MLAPTVEPAPVTAVPKALVERLGPVVNLLQQGTRALFTPTAAQVTPAPSVAYPGKMTQGPIPTQVQPWVEYQPGVLPSAGREAKVELLAEPARAGIDMQALLIPAALAAGAFLLLR